jgi:C-terminal processing protease CtpA/Prc
MLVYVKRLVAGGPADQVRCITPGDTLILIDGEDVYGWGLDVLRTRIPGPMGTSVRLGSAPAPGTGRANALGRGACGLQCVDLVSQDM